MEKAANKISNSMKLRVIVIYLAVITTIAVFTFGYNQHTTCTTQRANVAAANIKNGAIDVVINEQVKLYKIVLAGTASDKRPVQTNDEEKQGDRFQKALKTSIATLEEERETIKDNPSESAKCFIVGTVASGYAS